MPKPIAMKSGQANDRLPLGYRICIGLVLFLCIVVNAKQAYYYLSHGPRVSDFRIFMTGVEMVRSGQAHHLYDFAAQESVQHRLFPDTKTAGLLPFNHLAYELLFYAPLSALPYRVGLWTWAGINLVLLFVVLWLLEPYTRNLRRAGRIPLIVLLLAFYPLVYVFGEGQDSLLFFFFVALSLRSLDRGWKFAAGFALTLALFKFHLALLIVWFVFLLPRRWRELGGFAVGTAVVLAISLAIAGPHMLKDYSAMLSRQETVTPWGFIPWFMPNVRGMLVWGLSRWLEIGQVLPIVVLLSLGIWLITSGKIWRGGAALKSAELFAIAIPAVLLVSYHLHMQDLTIAAFPLLVFLDRAAVGMLSPARTTILLVGCTLFYLFRLAAEVMPSLLLWGCLLSVPLFCLWIVALGVVGAHSAEDSVGAEDHNPSYASRWGHVTANFVQE
jgi:hypothetical protein